MIGRGLLLLLASALPGVPQQAQDDGVMVEDARKDVLDRLARAEEAGNWKEFWAHVTVASRRWGHHAVSVEPNRWISLREHLLARSAALPREARDAWRFEHDGAALEAFARARESGRRVDLEEAVEEYFLSSQTDEVLDTLSRTAFDEGRPEEAIAHGWRLLTLCPDSDIPPEIVAARVAMAAVAAGREPALAEIRRTAERRKLGGRVRVGGRDLELAEFLAALELPPQPEPPVTSKIPFAYAPGEQDLHRGIGVSNDVLRWTYDFDKDRGDGSAPPENATPQMPVPRRFGRVPMPVAPPPGTEFPIFPAYARLHGREYLILCDGSRVTAVDPLRVQGASTTAGVYWKYPVDRAVVRGGPPGPRPHVGMTVDGEHVYVTLASTLQARPREPMANQEVFEGTTSVKCLHIPTGRLVWDTDSPALLAELQKLEFHGKPFSFSGPPAVMGDRLFVGACSSPIAEQQATVLCLQRTTGRPLWAATPVSFRGMGQAFFNQGRSALYQTTLLARGGVVYLQSNLGIVAALHPVTGHPLWITKYRRAGMRPRDTGQQEPAFFRAANPPVEHRGRLYVLPQDAPELLAFDAATGRPETLPVLKVNRDAVDPGRLTHLLGVVTAPTPGGPVEEWLVLGGQVSHVVRLRDFRAYTLAASDTEHAGRGTVHDGLLYLPVRTSAAGTTAPNAGQGVLGIYDLRTWRSLHQPPWRGENEFGNLLVAGERLVVATDRVSVYASVAAVRREFAARLDVRPARPEALLEFGDLMRDNERFEEAADAYLGFIRSADGDARWEPRIRQVRGDLHGIFLRRGDETADPARALELYAYAKGFAYDEGSRAEATRRMAETYERLGRWKEAVAQYQELIEDSRSLYHRPAEGLRKLWQHARERVDAIVQKAPDAYAEVEARAAEALRAARRQGGEALREVMDRFPNSETARDAWRALKDGLLEENQLERLRGLFKEFEERFRQKTTFDDRRAMLDVLERLGDVERLRVELERFAAEFADRPAGTPDRPETARAWAERRLAEIDARPRETPRAPAGPLILLAEWDAGEGEPLLPLAVAGLEPSSLPSPAGVFARGSTVELWDVPSRRRLWTSPRPWAWTGLTPAPADDMGLRIASVDGGSPAAQAGLRAGDLVLAIDGRPADARALWAAEPGRPLPLLRRREGSEETVRLTPAPWPAERRPAVKAAAWGRDGSLLVVWEDGAAALDVANGRVRWAFRDIRDRHAVRAVHASDGRLVLYEAERPEAGNAGRSEDAHHRLLAINDLTGDLAWGHLFPSDGGQGGETTVDFFGAPLAEHLALLRSTPRANVREWVLSTYRADNGERIDLRTLPGQVAAWAADVGRGAFYYVSEVAADRREKVLQSRSIDPSRRDFKQIDVPLKIGEMIPPQAAAAPTVLALAAEGDYVCLLAATGSDYRLRVFENGQLFRSLSLPAEGRMLPAGRPGGAVLQDGLLHVYNVPRDRSGGGPGRAFLTAFRVGTRDPSDLVAWEAVAPVLLAGPNASWTLSTDGGPLLALAAPGGSAPDQPPAAGGLVAVYDRSAGGYLRLAAPAAFEEDAAPVVFARGRLYVAARDALRAYGKP